MANSLVVRTMDWHIAIQRAIGTRGCATGRLTHNKAERERIVSISYDFWSSGAPKCCNIVTPEALAWPAQLRRVQGRQGSRSARCRAIKKSWMRMWLCAVRHHQRMQIRMCMQLQTLKVA